MHATQIAPERRRAVRAGLVVQRSIGESARRRARASGSLTDRAYEISRSSWPANTSSDHNVPGQVS
jgi:hypothetical protein